MLQAQTAPNIKIQFIRVAIRFVNELQRVTVCTFGLVLIQRIDLPLVGEWKIPNFCWQNMSKFLVLFDPILATSKKLPVDLLALLAQSKPGEVLQWIYPSPCHVGIRE